VANSLCGGREKRTMRKRKVQIGNSVFKVSGLLGGRKVAVLVPEA
jgi:hypothetical protein